MNVRGVALYMYYTVLCMHYTNNESLHKTKTLTSLRIGHDVKA